MIEIKLRQTAQMLPEPVSSFSDIEEKVNLNKKKTFFISRQYRRVAVILVGAFLLMGCVTVAAITEVNYGAWTKHYNDFKLVEKVTDKLGVVLPENLNDSPFHNISTMYVVPEGTTYLQAITTPAYRWYAIDYGVWDVVRKYNSDTQDIGFSERGFLRDAYSIAFGSTDGELCQYVFSLDESGMYNLKDIFPGSYRTEEYNGITLQILTEVKYDNKNNKDGFAYHPYQYRVIWVDVKNHIVFSLHKSFHVEEEAAEQHPDEIISLAKKIIDMNIAK